MEGSEDISYGISSKIEDSRTIDHVWITLLHIYQLNWKKSRQLPTWKLKSPRHTFPTDHMYFYANTSAYPDGFEIFAPGNLTITTLQLIQYGPPEAITYEDYSIEFSVCEHVYGKFGHVNNLSAFILDKIEGFGEEYGDDVNTWEVAGDLYSSFNKRIILPVNAGQVLGRAGIVGGYDFWLKDDRVILEWVNQDWTNEYQNTVCPLDYFNATLKSEMEAKLLRWGGIPVEPAGYSGQIEFDVPDHAQGIWVREDWSNRAEDNGLALVYNNFNASEGAISVGLAGNSSWDSRVYYFHPAGSGFRNRNFSQVSNDGNVYYYFSEYFKSGSIYTKVVLLKMTGSREILLHFIDYGTGEVPSDPSSLFNASEAIKYVR